MKRLLAVPGTWIRAAAFSAALAGTVGVVEAQTGSSSQGGGPNDALVMLLDQFNEMRAELATLRGIVEEQTYELRRLQQDSLDRYTDLDSRISALYQDQSAAAAQSAATPAGTVNTGQIAAPATTAVSPPAPASTSVSETGIAGTVAQPSQGALTATPSNTPPQMMTEQQLYQLALDSLLQDEQYQRSINEFDRYLAEYPAGRFVTNAWYWKGQAYVNLSMLEEARNAFEVIVTQYPDGRKVDDAMYSLGTVYDRLGNAQRSRELLEDVKLRYPNTSAANLADIYLRSMN